MTGGTAHRVLVLDDDEDVAESLSVGLSLSGYEVLVSTNPDELMADIGRNEPEVVILDVNMPKASGLELCSQMRKRGIETPVLFLSGRDTSIDKITGLEVGGDDYMTKPFHLGELASRLEALTRRSQLPGRRLMRFENLELDLDSKVVRKDDERVELTRTEYEILAYLMAHPERVLTREQIVERAWPDTWGVDPQIVETHISQLRRKLGDRPPRLIQTVRSFGYVLTRQQSN